MRIASWNINSLRKRRIVCSSGWRTTAPDVVCLQETKCTDEQFPELALRAAGYHSAFTARNRITASPFFRKSKPREVRASFCDEVVDDAGACDRGDGRRCARFFGLRAEWTGGRFAGVRLQDRSGMRACANCLDETENGSTDTWPLCGDFNVAPSDEDVHDPALWRGAIMCSDGERAAFQQLCVTLA